MSRKFKSLHKQVANWQQEFLNIATQLHRSMKIEMIEGKFVATFNDKNEIEDWLNGVEQTEPNGEQ